MTSCASVHAGALGASGEGEGDGLADARPAPTPSRPTGTMCAFDRCRSPRRARLASFFWFGRRARGLMNRSASVVSGTSSSSSSSLDSSSGHRARWRLRVCSRQNILACSNVSPPCSTGTHSCSAPLRLAHSGWKAMLQASLPHCIGAPECAEAQYEHRSSRRACGMSLNPSTVHVPPGSKYTSLTKYTHAACTHFPSVLPRTAGSIKNRPRFSSPTAALFDGR
mmetsp:Transcript_21658/g.76080  ORF Transcript_21658/g.76080 Transcript_21658/m.76080 type:complete len:224 (+) Transcript_21658:312-983(+)